MEKPIHGVLMISIDENVFKTAEEHLNQADIVLELVLFDFQTNQRKTDKSRHNAALLLE